MKRKTHRLGAGGTPDPNTCDLGRITTNHRGCARPKLLTIEGVRICWRHARKLAAIRRSARGGRPIWTGK